MKVLLTTLALLVPASGASLGIGIDVMSEAYTFAAHRVGFAADLRLTRCAETSCFWDLGDGVKLEGYVSGESLDLNRIEATLDSSSVTRSMSASRYDKACMAVVALVDRDASPDELRIAAMAISSASDDEPRTLKINRYERSIRLYGVSASQSKDARHIAKRCGAVAG